MGEIRCDKISRGVFHPQIAGFEKINVSSMGPYKWRGLSPMFLGPFEIEEPLAFEDYFLDGVHPGFTKKDDTTQTAIVKKFENYWQGSKIYSIDVSNGEVVKKSFFQRRAESFNLEKGKRRTFPKNKYSKPIWGYYNGEIMDYITSRKKIYCPSYSFLIQESLEYRELKRMVADGKNLLIVGPDGRDIPITEKKLKEAVNDPTYSFGHELVICSMLKNLQPWND